MLVDITFFFGNQVNSEIICKPPVFVVFYQCFESARKLGNMLQPEAQVLPIRYPPSLQIQFHCTVQCVHCVHTVQCVLQAATVI